jgi:cytochrome P450
MRAPTSPWNIPGTSYTVPAGDVIFISPAVTHNDDRWFEDPERFDPERFTPEAESAIPRGAYIPFALGTRMCLGKNFALMEAKLVLATMVRHVEPNVPSDYTPKFVAQLALRAANGVPFDVRLRQAVPAEAEAEA